MATSPAAAVSQFPGRNHDAKCHKPLARLRTCDQSFGGPWTQYANPEESFQGTDNKPVSEETRTVTVNAHGAMILLGLKVSIGQLLTLRNSRTGEEIACRVVYVSPHQSEKRQVGVDFMNPCPRFWRISFPPSDWTTRSPEAKGNPTKQK
jgi:hypothetical protein